MNFALKISSEEFCFDLQLFFVCDPKIASFVLFNDYNGYGMDFIFKVVFGVNYCRHLLRATFLGSTDGKMH